MKSNHLTRVQAYKIVSALHPSHQYLAELKAEMEDRGILADDKLFGLVETAHAAMQELVAELHFLNHERLDEQLPLD